MLLFITLASFLSWWLIQRFPKMTFHLLPLLFLQLLSLCCHYKLGEVFVSPRSGQNPLTESRFYDTYFSENLLSDSPRHEDIQATEYFLLPKNHNLKRGKSQICSVSQAVHQQSLTKTRTVLDNVGQPLSTVFSAEVISAGHICWVNTKADGQETL